MSDKRYFFKLEMEQLPERIWQDFKSTPAVQKIKIQEKSEIIGLIEQLPDPILDQLRLTLEQIWRQSDQKIMVTNPEVFTNAILSESSLAKKWLSPEEDEAWKDL